MTELSVSVSVQDGEEGSRSVIEVLDAETAKKPRLLPVDVSGLTFIGSAGLYEIVRAHRKLRADGCMLALVSPGPAVTRVLQLSGLDQVVPVRATLEETGSQ